MTSTVLLARCFAGALVAAFAAGAPAGNPQPAAGSGNAPASPPSLASPGNPELTVSVGGRMSTFAPAALLAMPATTTVTIANDVAYKRNMTFRAIPLASSLRSEERRVGKECRSRWSPYH